MGREAVFTKGGYSLPEVVSALQKSIRRGDERGAIYWAVEMYGSGYWRYLWKRMKIIVSEDIGLAEPGLPATFQALWETFLELREAQDSRHEPERLPLVHAVMLLARAKKSRQVDHALVWAFGSHEAERREIPDCALDKHTAEGKKRGRGWDHFWTEGARLENEVGIDPYRDEAIAITKAGTDLSAWGHWASAAQRKERAQARKGIEEPRETNGELFQ